MKVPGFLKAFAVVITCVLIPAGSATSAEQTDSKAFQDIITRQMSAFAANDGQRAFSFATETLRQRFQTPELFMEMVRQGYQPVYRPKGVTFGRSKVTKFGPTQEVYVTGPDGQDWIALYSFERQEDGSWRISGCYLTKADGLSA